MQLKQVKGDIFQYLQSGEIEAMGHCCNCQANFGAGIALTVKNLYPEVYERDRTHHSYHKKNSISQLGTMSFEKTNDGIIYNLYGQEYYGGNRPMDYEMIYTALEHTLDDAKYRQIKSIGFPMKMASDRAGGDWRIIEKMIEVVFEKSEIEVVIVEYDK